MAYSTNLNKTTMIKKGFSWTDTETGFQFMAYRNNDEVLMSFEGDCLSDVTADRKILIDLFEEFVKFLRDE